MIDVVFMGRKPVAARALHWLVERRDVTVVAVVTDSHLAISPVRALAEERDIPTLTREELELSIKDGSISFDLAVSVLYWQKIRCSVIAKPSLGVINFHPAPLPDYKGTAGYNLAILDALPSWAVSAHYVDEGIDTGDLIQVDWFDLSVDEETALTLEAKSAEKLLEMFKNVVARALAADALLPASSNVGGRYVSRAEMEEMKEVKPGDNIERKIRAFWFPPYDGAYKMIGGVKCTLIHRPILESLGNPETSSLFTSKSVP